MYFKNFPLLQYPTSGQLEQIQDILVRVGFSDRVKESAGSFLLYDIKEGTTPEQVALEVYGDQKYFWVVLLFNDLTDPQYSFPLRSRSLDSFIDKKYPSKTLFLSPEGITQEFFKHPLGAGSEVQTFTEGDTITLYLGKRNSYKDMGQDKVLGIIKKYIPELSAVQLYQLEGTITPGDVIVRGYNTEIRGQVRKVIDSRYALHHFENDNITLNPMATPPDDLGNQVPLGQTGDGFSSIPVGVTQTVLENYINDNDTNYIITNEEYEFGKNELNRKLKLLSPELLENVVRELREVLST
tara:strand:- start:344 stop:1234 length:891 start_codon:yes stop_codon:yes gene_type:complete